MKWTGLTGGIATGKSTARKLIQGMGFAVVDADEISYQLSSLKGKAYPEIVSHFGKSILSIDQSIDRKKLGQIVFNDQKSKKVLEEILHPLIRTEVNNQKELLIKRGDKLAFYDVPLLFEKDLQKNFDSTVLIWCDPQTQINRLMLRNQLTHEEAVARISNQIPLIQKIKWADHCVDNSGSLEDLEKQIHKLLNTMV